MGLQAAMRRPQSCHSSFMQHFNSPGGDYAALGVVQLKRSSLPLYEAQLGYQIEENLLKEHVWNRKKEVL